MLRASLPISSGVASSSQPSAAAVAAIAADTSAVLLAIPLPRGSGLDRRSDASTSERPKRSSASTTARLAFGAWTGAKTRPLPREISTVAVAYMSMGQLTRKYPPSIRPCASSPQLPGTRAAARETPPAWMKCVIWTALNEAPSGDAGRQVVLRFLRTRVPAAP